MVTNNDTIDLVVIGSGFGGSVCAARAAEAGLRVLLLERGPRWSEDDLNDLAAAKRPFFKRRNVHGIVELHQRRGFGALTANALGGGSRIYTSVTVRAPMEVFANHWPGLSRASLDAHYDRVERTIAPTPMPIELDRMRVLEPAARKLGGAVTRLPLAMNWPDESGEMRDAPSIGGLRAEAVTWLRGGRHSRKRTLVQTYLKLAEQHGADIRPLHEATAVTPGEDGYRITCRAYRDDDATDTTFHARRVVLAAGTLSTIRLLFHCRDVCKSLPAIGDCLGRRFFTNGDFGALIVGAADGPAADSGPPVTAWADLWRDDRMFLMDTGIWPIGAGVVTLSPKWSRAWSIAVMGYADAPARLMATRRGVLYMTRTAGASAAFDRRRIGRLRELASLIGGRLLAPPAFLDARMPFTVHPMGGAVMADSPERGVTDPYGEVYGYPGLYIADASLFPTPTGVAPSMTIAAVAEHVIANMLRSC